MITLRRAAYHEGGHAIVSEILDPGSVNIVSIRSTDGDTLGFVRYCIRGAFMRCEVYPLRFFGSKLEKFNAEGG